MKAAVVDAVGAGFKVSEVDLAQPAGREVLMDVRASGLCHTDLTIATQDMGVFRMPVLCGHEIAGVVASAGPQVTEFQAGERVAACLVQSCGTCAVCLAGRPYQCPRGATLVRSADQAPRITRAGAPVTQAFGLGGFAQQALRHENQLVKIPCRDAVPASSPAWLRKARRFSATDVINSATVSPVEAVRDLLPTGVDGVFDFVGLSEVTTQALNMLAVGGTLYLVPVCSPDSQVTVNLVDAVLKQPRVVGVNTGSTNFKRDVPLYSQLYLDGRFELDALLSAEINLDQMNPVTSSSPTLM